MGVLVENGMHSLPYLPGVDHWMLVILHPILLLPTLLAILERVIAVANLGWPLGPELA